jgi:hypothetical protein
VTERVYEDKKNYKPIEHVQTIAILKYKHNIACSPRTDHHVTSKNFITTDEDIETDDKSPVLQTHRVRTAKFSKIQYTGPTQKKFKSNLFSLVYLDA